MNVWSSSESSGDENEAEGEGEKEGGGVSPSDELSRIEGSHSKRGEILVLGLGKVIIDLPVWQSVLRRGGTGGECIFFKIRNQQ